MVTRRWRLSVELTADVDTSAPPAGVELIGRAPRLTAIVDRHKLTDAIDLIVAAFGGRENPPIVRSATLFR